MMAIIETKLWEFLPEVNISVAKGYSEKEVFILLRILSFVFL